MNCRAQIWWGCVVKSFKVLFVPFLSFALIFSSSPTLAQNLVDTVPDFYYLENLNDDSLLIQACSRSKIKDHATVANLSTVGLDCVAVAEVSKEELYNFLAEAIDEAKNHFNRSNLSYKRKTAGSFIALVSGVGLYAWGGWLVDPSKSKNGMLLVASGIVLAMGGFTGLLGFGVQDKENEKVSIIPQTLEEQVHTGLVGQASEGQREILNLFTDFLNEHGVPLED